MLTRIRSRRALMAFALGAGASLGLAVPGQADVPVDSDIFVFAATANLSPALGPGPMSSTYAFQPSTCFFAPLPVAPPSPLPSSVPGYVDVPPDESGSCTSVSGGGSLTDLVACSTGLISTAWNLTEPSGDVAKVDATGVVVGGVVIAAALPGGYQDDGAGTGAASVTGLMLPQIGGNTCVSGVEALQFTALVAAVY